MILTVHDELLIESPKDAADEVAAHARPDNRLGAGSDDDDHRTDLRPGCSLEPGAPEAATVICSVTPAAVNLKSIVNVRPVAAVTCWLSSALNPVALALSL